MLLIPLRLAKDNSAKRLWIYISGIELVAASALNLGQSAASFNCFSLLLDRRLFIRPSDFQFLEQAAFRKFVFQNFESLLYVVINYFYFQ